MRGDTGNEDARARDASLARRFVTLKMNEPEDGITDNKFFISERRKCRWWQQAIDSGDDRGATAVSIAGRACGDDSAASGRRRQTT